jgi:hypothetical protein
MIVREAASAAEQALKRHRRWCAGTGMESSYPLMARGGLGWRSRPERAERRTGSRQQR